MVATVLNDNAAQLQALMTDLCKDGSHCLLNFEELLEKILQRVSDFDVSICDDSSAMMPSLENSSVLLWNKTVLLKTKGIVPNATIAKLRHVAFKISILSCSSSRDETVLRKMILMGLKTSRAWIDCKQFDKAESILIILNQMIQTLQSVLVERANTDSPNMDNQSGTTQDKPSLEEDIFKILTYWAEVYCGQDKQEEAMQCVYRAKDLLFGHLKEAMYLGYLCYNFGVSAYGNNDYLHCIFWLRESYDLGKTSGVSNKAKSKTLRLLATAYLDWKDTGYLEKALSAVTLANTEFQHPAGLFLSIHILLESKKDPSVIKAGVNELLQHSECSIDLCHNLLLLLQQYSADLEECPFSETALLRYQNSPEYGHLKLAYLMLILKFSVNDAKLFARDSIIAAHTSKETLDAATRKQFHILYWDQAAQVYEKGRYADALDWYNYSLSLHNTTGDDLVQSNLVKLHRNRASCHMELQQLPQAKEALNDAQSVDRASVHTNFLFYKLALMEADTEAARSALQAMINIQQEEPRNCEAGSEDHSHSLLSLAAQMALEHKHTSLAKTVLKSLMETNSDRRQTLKAARCLIRLTITSYGTAEASLEADARTDLISYFRIAHSSLLALRGSEDMDKETLETEAAWFMKVAWNFALKNEKELAIMKDLFLVCYNLMPLCKTDKQTLDHKKACLLMATAACIQMARSTDSRQDMKRLLEEALVHISENNSVDCVSLEATWRNGESQVLLLLYEFEALVKLFDPRAESVLERALVIPNSEPRIFESLAALAMERPVGHNRLAMRALKMAVHLHLTAQHPDFSQCSKDIHSLIQVSLSYSEDEAFTYFMEAANMIEKRAEGEYPQMETMWLMTKAWNTGIRHYCNDQYRQAEQWCALSMRFLTHLGSLRLDYEGQETDQSTRSHVMMSVYSEILDNMDKQKSAMDVTMK